MGLDDVMGQAKDLLAGHQGEVDSAIDSAEQAVKDKAPDQIDGALDAAAQAAKDAI